MLLLLQHVRCMSFERVHRGGKRSPLYSSIAAGKQLAAIFDRPPTSTALPRRDAGWKHMCAGERLRQRSHLSPRAPRMRCTGHAQHLWLP